jgi:hypothetical protein
MQPVLSPQAKWDAASMAQCWNIIGGLANQISLGHGAVIRAYLPEYDGNSMYRTAGNILVNPNVGLLFVSFDGKSRRIRVNGRASIHEDADTLARHFGAKFVVRIACEIYPNCPRYLPDLQHGRPSPHPPRPGAGRPPGPEWKTRDYIRDTLPADDPHRE